MNLIGRLRVSRSSVKHGRFRGSLYKGRLSDEIVPGVTLSIPNLPNHAQRLHTETVMISLIQLRNASTTFPDSSSPQNQALDWKLSNLYSSDE